MPRLKKTDYKPCQQHTRIPQLMQSYVAFNKRLPVRFLISSNNCHSRKVSRCITVNFAQYKPITRSHFSHVVAHAFSPEGSEFRLHHHFAMAEVVSLTKSYYGTRIHSFNTSGFCQCCSSGSGVLVFELKSRNEGACMFSEILTE